MYVITCRLLRSAVAGPTQWNFCARLARQVCVAHRCDLICTDSLAVGSVDTDDIDVVVPDLLGSD